MAGDPDYLDPEVLRERMAAEPAVELKPSRPKVRRVPSEGGVLDGAVAVASATATASFAALRVERPGLSVVEKRVTISR